MFPNTNSKPSHKDDMLHVFVVNSPICVIMSILIADHLKIPKTQCIAVSHRDSHTKHTGFSEMRCEIGPYDRYINRITGWNLSGRRLKSTLEAEGKPFTLYCAWVLPEVEELVKSRNCRGFCLFEEGQQTYYKAQMYKNNFFNTWRFRRSKVLAGAIDYYFRDDAIRFFCLDEEGFPLIPSDRKTVLNDLSATRQAYKPQLKDIPSFGLMPAPRRLPSDKIWPAVEALINSFDGPGAIKFHPGFKAEANYSADSYDEKIRSLSNDRVRLCADDILLELEMFHEPKQLYGARSSLVRYARKLGSEFTYIDFDGYIEPKN